MASDNRMRDPYAILGISRTADQLEIKAAWRNVAKKLHPDHNRNDPQAQTRFTEAGRAYDLLKDPDKRRRYDEMLNRTSFGGGASSAYAPGRAGGAKEPTFMEKRAERARAEAEAKARVEAEARMRAEAEAEARAKAAAEARARAEAEGKASAAAKPAAGSEMDEETQQAFTKIFGERRKADRSAEAPAGNAEQAASKPEQAKPESAKAESARTDSAKAEAAKPAEKAAPQEEAQPDVESSDPQAEGAPSPALNLISYLVKRLTGQVPAPEKAPDLNIDAMVSIEDLVNRVNPAITLPDGKLLSITLPDGAMDGTTVRMDGYGHKLPHMRRGDVLATLRVKPHKWYRTDFYDLRTFHDIDIENAVLGCDATVETLDGPVRIKVPEWSGSDRTVKVPGKGLPKGNGMRGDLIVEIRVMLWDHPDQKVIDLMRALREGLFL
ncbi:J domain-containing protein [Rhizobium sp. TH2]|uniref:DnaJ C-terminal domain-containing protein n=1 Tax=Rhizobium sp. TH2 TaxID=2775403 RepID=UPI0021587715|nr:DnaJ C-terminal domain-containing protein [Rhizobium sp. TH2]UVC10074.1 J domain-containing protein [Rhizobium sp. TH2]